MHNQVSEILADKGIVVESVEPGATVLQAVERMNERGIGAVLVVEGDRPVGIFTERDVLMRVVAKRLDPVKAVVSDVMTKTLVTIAPTTTVREAMVTVTQKRCRHLPVVEDGVVRGMVSAGDLTRWLVRDQQAHIEDLENYVTRG